MSIFNQGGIAMQINRDSMMAHSDWLNSTSNNIANSTNRGYNASRTVIEGGENSKITAFSSNIGDSVELSKEIGDMVMSEKGFNTQIATIKTEENMIGTLLNIKR